MEAQLRFIQQDQRGWIGLQQQGGEADETQGAVGQRIGVEVGLGAFLPPFQLDLPLVELAWSQHELLKERRNQPDVLLDVAELHRMLYLQPVEVGRQIGFVRGEKPVFVQVHRLLGGRGV